MARVDRGKATELRKDAQSVESAYVEYISKGHGQQLYAAYSVEAQRELAMADPTISCTLPASMNKAASPYPPKTTMSMQRGAVTLTQAVEDFMQQYPELVALGSKGRRKALESIVASPATNDVAVVRAAMAQADAARDTGMQLQRDALA